MLLSHVLFIYFILFIYLFPLMVLSTFFSTPFMVMHFDLLISKISIKPGLSHITHMYL